MDIIMIVWYNYLFTCLLSSSEADYKISASKQINKTKQNTYTQKITHGNVCHLDRIAVIVLVLVVVVVVVIYYTYRRPIEGKH
jgi:hypothetical protein